MKIYNFLFDPDLNNLRLNMDASLVDPLENGKNIEKWCAEMYVRFEITGIICQIYQ